MILPIKWETHASPEFGDHPQTIINRQILDEADIVVGVFGTRLGTPTESYVSGTVEEIKRHVAAGKTAMIYFSDVPVPPSSLDPHQYAALQEFRKECQGTSLYGVYCSIDQFKTDFSHHLDLHLNQPRYRWLGVSQESEGPRKTAEYERRLAHVNAALNKMEPHQIDLIRWALDRGEQEETRVMNGKTGLHPHSIREGIMEGERAGLISVRMVGTLLAPGGDRFFVINPDFKEALVDALHAGGGIPK